MMMPGLPLVEGRYFQELAPEVGMDRPEIAESAASVKTKAGGFKLYAPWVGQITDGDLKLVKYGVIASGKN